MKTTLIVNPKGGCGKSTIATNLASYYARAGAPVALVDYDPQKSSLAWLEQRGASGNPIHGIDGGAKRISLPGATERVVMDSPARIEAGQMERLFKFSDSVLLPVLPSPVDIRAAAQFLGELMLSGLLKSARVGLIANRVRENTLIYVNLERFLRRVKLPLVAHLREAQNYNRAAISGRGIFDMPPHLVNKDLAQWKPLIRWVEKG
ncbi:MAG: AAA family ATPase [Gammaproteobacteria bacterium]|nr:AAA family ATPase [Gammaproteobacteria bacterium]CAJ2376988.1 MAG: Chromosome partitioning protein [Arenicellales bacterium IbO2]MDA7961617.1 AAA family ATPase [Gammaproteobacteria bacterium]MDA7968149.1 AAA family ATPase [Gammaproteobacteria bacterium]MDA7970018.1 AAA family ATPase [Gammaproteobacteria bacterium]